MKNCGTSGLITGLKVGKGESTGDWPKALLVKIAGNEGVAREMDITPPKGGAPHQHKNMSMIVIATNTIGEGAIDRSCIHGMLWFKPVPWQERGGGRAIQFGLTPRAHHYPHPFETPVGPIVATQITYLSSKFEEVELVQMQ